MNEQGFVERREEDWIRLTRLCDRADAGATKLSGAEVREFVRLYRRVSSDLALARTKTRNVALTDFLNDLLARAYGTLYRTPRTSLWRALLNGAELSAQTVRRRKWFVLASAFFFFGSAFYSYWVLTLFPGSRDVLIPPQFEAIFGSWKTGQFPERQGSESVMASGYYASHNPEVAILTGAVGAGTFGAFSVVMLYESGSMLGSLAHELVPEGKLGFLLSSVAPHGVQELSGAVISGAAGLLLGWALINPGRRSRRRALQEVGQDAIVLLATSVILMLLAAPIEGFFSFNPHIPQGVKIVAALACAAFWAVFWTTFGQPNRVSAPASPEQAPQPSPSGTSAPAR